MLGGVVGLQYMYAKFSQYAKVFSPIDLTLLPIVIRSRAEQPLKADFPIEIILSGITTLVRCLQAPNTLSPISVRPLPIVILLANVQPQKALFSMVLTLSGIVMLCKYSQP